MRIAQSKRKLTPSKILVGLLIIAIFAGGLGVYSKASNSWPFQQTDTSDTSDKNGGTISPAIENHTKNGGGSGQDSSSTAGTGVTDTGGENVDDSPDGVSSKSGNITLYSPVAGQKLNSGITVKGSAKVPTVQYRVSDSLHGQIGQGSLDVSNGHFSGTVAVHGTDATSGTFEVYSFNSEGQEVNNIKIAIKY